jgi:hypothetical protein
VAACECRHLHTRTREGTTPHRQAAGVAIARQQHYSMSWSIAGYLENPSEAEPIGSSGCQYALGLTVCSTSQRLQRVAHVHLLAFPRVPLSVVPQFIHPCARPARGASKELQKTTQKQNPSKTLFPFFFLSICFCIFGRFLGKGSSKTP